MASPVVPMHGKLGALYVLRPFGFSGNGLNDAVFTGSASAATEYFTVTIDATVASPDTFAWTINGAGGAAGVACAVPAGTALGADGEKVSFAAVDGHLIGDKWVVGNLRVEPCTVNGNVAQITSTARRLLNPNYPPTFTPTNAVHCIAIDFVNGTATFDAAPGVTTASGNNGFIPLTALRKVGYLLDWSLSVSLDMADCSRMGQAWKEALPGQAGATGSANAYFIGSDTLLSCLQQSIASGDKYFLLQLFNYDPDQDQTGDHINAWVTFTSFATNADIGSVVKEAVNFQVHGGISFVANV